MLETDSNDSMTYYELHGLDGESHSDEHLGLEKAAKFNACEHNPKLFF